MFKQDFPLLHTDQELIYFDSAATTQKPARVIAAIERFYAQEYGTVHRAIYRLAGQATERYQGVREEVKTFLNAASVEEIIFTKGTTEAINLVASSFGRAFIKPQDEIIISEMEHHSNIVPWQLLCERQGALLKVIPIDDSGALILEEFEKLLSDRTRLVSIAHIANATGTLNPVEKIIEMAHQWGAKVFIDGAQSAAHMPVDVQKLDADFFAFSGHKAFGPTGIGILYGKRALLDVMPPYQGGGDMIERVTFEETFYQEPPLRFEAGTPPIAQVIGLGEALAYIESIGRPQIAQCEQALLDYATSKLLEIPTLRLIGTAPRKGAILTFTIPGLHPLDIGTLLDLRKIAIRTGHLCAQPTMRRFGITTAARISFAPYNTFEEIDLFITAIQEVIQLINL
jgi:cysteine desulfurase / selenocysteine lyase